MSLPALSEADQDLLKQFIRTLRDINQEDQALIIAVARRAIVILRQNNGRLTVPELLLVVQEDIRNFIHPSLKQLLQTCIDPDMGFGELGEGMRPRLHS
jgi:hypothetical protein